MGSKIDQGNKMLNMDLVPRDENGSPIDPKTAGVLHLYRAVSRGGGGGGGREEVYSESVLKAVNVWYCVSRETILRWVGSILYDSGVYSTHSFELFQVVPTLVTAGEARFRAAVE